MSKTNGQTPTPGELLAAAKLAIELVTEATTGPYRLTEQKHGNTRYNQRVIRAAKNWRRRPRRNAPKWPEFDDVATLCGGESEQARKNGELLAAAPELLKMLARGVLELQAATENDKLKPVIGQYRPTKETIDLYYFLANIASALDCVVEPDHRLGRNPFDALLGGTTEQRKNRAELLHALGDTMDPLNQEARKRAKHPSERLNGTPTVQTFLDEMPDYVREHYNVELIHEADLMYAAEFARLNLISQQKWDVSAEQLMKSIALRVAMPLAWQVELDYDCTLSPEVRDEIRSHFTPSLNLDLLDGPERSDEAQAWIDDHTDSVDERVVLLMHDEDWLRDSELSEKFLAFLASKPSDQGMALDITDHIEATT